MLCLGLGRTKHPPGSARQYFMREFRDNFIGMSETPTACWLCRRPLGRRVEWHHPRPKSRGGRVKEAVHPICHRAIHANFSNAELARLPLEPAVLAAHPAIARFLKWIAGKPPDFHAPTRGDRR
jgi:hypothetical protein